MKALEKTSSLLSAPVLQAQRNLAEQEDPAAPRGGCYRCLAEEMTTRWGPG